jgi:hypothetical protein
VKRLLSPAVLIVAMIAAVHPHSARADCAGTVVTPAQNLVAVVAAGAIGETFCLADGRYRVKQSVKPKQGQAIMAQTPRGALIDGQGVVNNVVYSTDAGVTVVDVRVTGGRNDGIYLTGAGSAVVNVESFGNARKGLNFNSNAGRVSGGSYHHNGVYGVSSVRGVDQVWSGVEVSYNRLGGSCDGASGGSKFAETVRLHLVGSNFHHNQCNGIWFDINNADPVIQGNSSSDNQGIGIVCEISFRCLILENDIRRNGGAGIIVRGSSDVEIARNLLVGNQTSNGGNGDLVLYGVNRTDYPTPLGPHLTRRNVVHHNTVISTTRTPKVGVINTADPDPSALFDPASNVFRANDYDVPRCEATVFKWSGSLTWSVWRSVPQDADEESSCM